MAQPLRMVLMAVFAMLAAAFSGTAPAMAQQLVVDDPNDSTLNLRAGPGTGHRVIIRMPSGTVATLAEQRGDWARICHESGRVGWAYFHYLIDERPGQPAAMIVQNPRRDDLNLCSGPGTNSRALNRVRNGVTVLVFARRGDWVWVRLSDGRSLGWAYEQFLIPAPQLAPQPEPAPPAPPPVAAAPVPEPAPPPPSAQPPQERVILSAREPYVFLHAGPDDSTARLSRCANGTRVIELAVSGGWAEVISPDGARGWVDALWLVTPEEWWIAQGTPAPALAAPALPPPPPPLREGYLTPPATFEGVMELEFTHTVSDWGQSFTGGRSCSYRMTIDSAGVATWFTAPCLWNTNRVIVPEDPEEVPLMVPDVRSHDAYEYQ